MRKKILTISGWAQDEQLISNILELPSKHLNYTNKQFNQIVNDIQNCNYDCVIGWSLGGQIALKLIPYISTKKLILISTPYQFVKKKNYNLGIPEKEFNGFEYLLKKNRTKLLSYFKNLILENRKLEHHLTISTHKTEHLLYWLHCLRDFNGKTDLNIEKHTQVPPTKIEGNKPDKSGGLNRFKKNKTLLIYGKNDKIVNYRQGEEYHKQIDNSSLTIFPNASHTPFLDDIEKFNMIVKQFING